MDQNIKCKKCRSNLIDYEKIVTEHGNQTQCLKTNTNTSNIFLMESDYPEWIKLAIKLQNWRKGKIHCPDCNTKIGGFDFIESVNCDCGESKLPEVSFTRSKIDLPLRLV